ncbi:E-beta-farnesene synthase [Tanacetum coccineum]
MHDTKMVKDFRPITLIGSLYKIIAKILANRLVVVLGDIVNAVQSAFVANRKILVGSFILNELFHWCKKKKIQTMIFKVDFEKAYDLVRWDYLDDVLNKFSFGDRWCGWIQICLRSSRGSIIMIVFTKLIIHHLQSKHKFYPRPDSPVHLPYEEYVLGYLKFSAKGTKREVFGMPIPNNLITTDIQGEQYYNAYLEKVAKHQRYLVGEEVSDPDSPAPKPAKATKPKATKQSKPLAPKAAPVTKPATAKALKPTASQPPKPTPATTKPSKKDQSKKRKLVKESSEAQSPAKQPKASKVIKKRTQKSSLQLVDEFVDEGVPVNEPRFGDEEADVKKAVEESLKDVYAGHQGPLLPAMIREPESRKFQPLPEVQGKGKEKVDEEQAAQVLLNLQTLKKKSHADQFIFQRRTPVPTKPLGHEESSSLYAELGLTNSEMESDDDVSPKINPEAQDKGQAGPNPGKQVEGQAGSNPGDDVESQPQSSHVGHAGPNLEHMDFEATNASTQQNPEQMDEGFIATAYLKVQENLKLTVKEQVVLEEPPSSTGSLSFLQHLTKDFSFGDQFFNDKPSEVENDKTAAETEAESMVSVTIHQDTSAIPPMTSPVIDLISRPDSPNEHRLLPAIATTTATTTTSITTLPLPPQPQQM